MERILLHIPRLIRSERRYAHSSNISQSQYCTTDTEQTFFLQFYIRCATGKQHTNYIVRPTKRAKKRRHQNHCWIFIISLHCCVWKRACLHKEKRLNHALSVDRARTKRSTIAGRHKRKLKYNQAICLFINNSNHSAKTADFVCTRPACLHTFIFFLSVFGSRSHQFAALLFSFSACAVFFSSLFSVLFWRLSLFHYTALLHWWHASNVLFFGFVVAVETFTCHICHPLLLSVRILCHFCCDDRPCECHSTK